MFFLLHDIRHGARVLRRNALFTVVAALALALAIGTTSAVYAVVHAALLRPLPFRDADRLMAVEATWRGEEMAASHPDIRDLAARSRTLVEVAGFRAEDVVLGGGATPTRLPALAVTPSLFRALQATPAMGRTFDSRDARADADTVILSHALWKERFLGDAGVVGKTVSLDGHSLTVIGVLPAGLRFPLDADGEPAALFLPYPHTVPQAASAERRDEHSLRVVGRLRPDVTLVQARADLETVSASLRKDYPSESDDAQLKFVPRPLQEQLVAPIKVPLLLLIGAVACVLAIACANIAILLLASGTVRQRELAVRRALGATRGRIVRQLLAESVLLAVLGAAGGAVAGEILLTVVVRAVREHLPRFADVSGDHIVVTASCVLAVAATAVFALGPSLRGAGGNLQARLKSAGRATAHRDSRFARDALVFAEVALAVALAACAGLAVRSLVELGRVDVGFQAKGLVAAQVSLPSARYGGDDEQAKYYRALRVRIEEMPGARGLAFGAPLPFSSSDVSVSISQPGHPPDPAMGSVLLTFASPNYFDVLGCSILAGRPFTVSEDSPSSRPVTVLSEEAARRIFGGTDAALGKRVSLGYRDIDAEVVGVVRDVRHESLDQEARPAAYLPMGRASIGKSGVLVRTDAPAAFVPMLRQAMLGVDGELPPTLLAPVDTLVRETVGTQRTLALLLGVIAAIAVGLACAGVYGVLSYTVAQRTVEIGIRMALGATRARVLVLVVREAMVLALPATAVGACLAMLLGGWLRSVLYGVTPSDPIALATVVLGTLFVCLGASAAPGWRATRISPRTALADL